MSLEFQREKKARCDITNISLTDLFKIIKKFEGLPYEGYVQKRSKHEPTESYFDLSRHLSECMMRLNFYVGPVRMNMTNMQNMKNSEMST